MINYENLHIRVNGERSRRANIMHKLKCRHETALNTLYSFKHFTASYFLLKLEELDYYWTHHEKMVR